MENVKETFPVPLYSPDSETMDALLSHHSQEKINHSKLPASNTLAVASPKFPTSSYVELQSVPTPLVPAILNTNSATSIIMVVDPTPVAPVTVTPIGLCQDNVPDTSDPPCIDLLGGEIIPSQLNCLSADWDSKKLYPLDFAHPDLMDSRPPSPPLENVDTSELPMLNAGPTMPQIPDFSGATQALSCPSTTTLLHAGSAKDTIGDDIWTNPNPPPLVAPFTAPTVPDRPPAAPDPVTGVNLPTTTAPYDCTTTQFGQPPDGAVQTIPTIVMLLEIHATHDCTLHSEMKLSHIRVGNYVEKKYFLCKN